MKGVSDSLLRDNLRIERLLSQHAVPYLKMKDARWMFAFAHYRITQEINRALRNPGSFRDPDQLIRFNIAFATAFLAAVSGMTTPPWKKAFEECATAQFLEDTYRLANACTVLPVQVQCLVTEGAAVQVCAIAMANVHINTDIVGALRTVGCIDRNDYGNVLLFVEIGALDAILRLHGQLQGEVYNFLKQALLPLEKVWRNSVYEAVCKQVVPDVEKSFRNDVERNTRRMTSIHPSIF